MRTARRMGLRTIAVYSDADTDAAFVREADDSVWIGGALASESYLRQDRIIEAALETRAETIHPGYGFLSENAEFADRVGKAGLTWIGPPPEAIRAMGLKDAAKTLMEKYGVSVTPGYHGADQSLKRLKSAAKSIGYPVLIKAVAGGGGRGMRKVEEAIGFETALEGAQREAMSSFGDDRVLVEKFVENPRHIEVQVFGDNHGNLIHLFERDCSLQRRRQKVIEEAPAPGMTAAVREAMTNAALVAASAVGYRNAGTVEFIVDGSGALRPDGFWFMEMNTRLQVEHPVTELVTGRDLVEMQLRVASGERLPAQAEIALSGHAVEARLCAEDPATGFLPGFGRLEAFNLPAFACAPSGGATLRLDSGVEEGDAVPAAYDSMIAKAIAHACSRDVAMDALADALRDAEIWPVATNAAMLANLLDHEEFRQGTATTSLVETHLDDVARLSRSNITAALVLGAAGLGVLQSREAAGPWEMNDGFRINGSARTTFVFDLAGMAREIRIETLPDGRQCAYAGGEVIEITINTTAINAGVLVGAQTNGEDHVGTVRHMSNGPVLFTLGHALALSPPRLGEGLDGLEATSDVRAPMPGKVLQVSAAAGQRVRKGEALVVMEAMKMEHTLVAPRDGTVLEVLTSVGLQTSDGAVLVRLEPLEN